jgi:hypothetical protein
MYESSRNALSSAPLYVRSRICIREVHGPVIELGIAHPHKVSRGFYQVNAGQYCYMMTDEDSRCLVTDLNSGLFCLRLCRPLTISQLSHDGDYVLTHD